MGAFLGVAKGSIEPLSFVEIKYNEKLKTQPLVLVGKGITFDRFVIFGFLVYIIFLTTFILNNYTKYLCLKIEVILLLN